MLRHLAGNRRWANTNVPWESFSILEESTRDLHSDSVLAFRSPVDGGPPSYRYPTCACRIDTGSIIVNDGVVRRAPPLPANDSERFRRSAARRVDVPRNVEVKKP